MTLSFTIDILNTAYAILLVYSYIALFMVFSTPHWPAGTVKTRGEFLITALVALIPVVNVIVLTTQLAMSGKYRWLAEWFDAPLKPGTQDVQEPDAEVESSPIIQQLETNDDNETRT